MHYYEICNEHKIRAERFINWGLLTNKECEELFKRLWGNIERWKKIDDENKSQFYMNNMFDDVKTIFDLQVRGDLEHHDKTGHLVYQNSPLDAFPSPDILIQLVGFSIEPLLLSTLTIQPKEKLFLIYTKETVKDYKNPLCKYLEEKGLQTREIIDKFYMNGKNMCIVDSSRPGDILKVIIGIICENKGKDIAIDITGGKKSMVSEAFFTSTVFDLTMYYVDYEEYLKTTPFPGTEFLSKLPNPKGYNYLKDKIKELKLNKEAVDKMQKSVGIKKALEDLYNDRRIPMNLGGS